MAEKKGRPMHLSLVVEATIEVNDPDALKQDALACIDASSYTQRSVDPETGLAEQTADRQRVEESPCDAFGRAFDIERGVDSIPGVECTESTTSVSENGVELTGSTPDFAALYVVCSCGRESCHKCDGFQLTPRTAAALWHELQVLSDMTYQDVLLHGDEPVDNQDVWQVLDRYPTITYHQDAVWRRQAARAFDDLCSDLETGDWPTPRSFGEEMALHLALDDAPATVTDLWDAIADLLEPLPEHADDFCWDAWRDLFFEDTDILTLFNKALDGIEDPESELNSEQGMGDMRPVAWFRPFKDIEPRDGRRPFRR